MPTSDRPATRQLSRNTGNELPTQARAFAALVRSCRTEARRYELQQRVFEELPRRWGIYRRGPSAPPIAGTAQGRLLESRLLELSGTPRKDRDFGGFVSSLFESWNLLVHLRSKALARRLSGWLKSSDAELACEAAHRLAWMGLKQDRARVLGLLKTAPWPMRGAIAEGLELAAHHGHIDAAAKERALRALVPLASGEVPVPAGEANDAALFKIVDAVQDIGGRKGLALICRDEAMHARNRAIRAVLLRLDSARREGLKVARFARPEMLWPIYESLRPTLDKSPSKRGPRGWETEQSLGCILLLVAESDPVGTARECRRILSETGKDDKRIRDDAKAALKLCKGALDPWTVLATFHRKPGAFGARASKVLRVMEMMEHCINDGLPLYFANLGEHWREAMAGLKIIGCTEARKVLGEGGRFFEASGPVKGGRSAMVIYEGLDDASIRKLGKLGDKLDAQFGAMLRGVEREMGNRKRDYARR